MEKVFGYIRVSGKGQVNGDGFKRQEKAIRDYAKANKMEVAHIYREKGVSGTLKDRPALSELIYSLEQNGHGIHTVVIERIDRLARDLMIQETILDDFKKNGVSVLSATDGDLLEDSPTRTLVRQVLGAIAEYDKEMTVQKLRVARNRKKAETGKCEGRKSYSELNPGLVQMVKQLRRKPPKGKRMPMRLICEKVNAAGYRTTKGKEFTVNTLKNIIYK